MVDIVPSHQPNQMTQERKTDFPSSTTIRLNKSNRTNSKAENGDYDDDYAAIKRLKRENEKDLRPENAKEKTKKDVTKRKTPTNVTAISR